MTQSKLYLVHYTDIIGTTVGDGTYTQRRERRTNYMHASNRAQVEYFYGLYEDVTIEDITARQKQDRTATLAAVARHYHYAAGKTQPTV